MRVLAAIIWPIATLDRYLTDRRTHLADAQRARDMAVTAAIARGEYFRTTLADDMGRDCDA